MSFSLILQISCISFLLIMGYMLTNLRGRRNIGIVFIGLFFITLGFHYAILIASTFEIKMAAIMVDPMRLPSIFLHAYIAFIYLANYHYVRDLDRIDIRRLWVFMVLLFPISRIWLTLQYGLDLQQWDEFTSFSGLIFITCFGIWSTNRSKLRKAEKGFLIHLNAFFLVMCGTWVLVIFNRLYPLLNENTLIVLFLFFQLYLVVRVLHLTFHNRALILEKQSDAASRNGLVKYQNSNLSSQEIEEMGRLVSEEVYRKELFLDENLSIDQLSERLSISSRHLSQVINHVFNTNFSDYINEFRLERAKTLLAASTSKEMNINQIMYESGFSSKSNFFKLFKKKTGMTPKQYRSELNTASIEVAVG